tara:strand:- start:41 stop:712 length:672 start_codon:yes stop_codon:yes gene_type:complete
MGWLTAIKVVGAIAGAISSSKSRPKKSEYEKMAPLETGNIHRGEAMVKRHRFFQDKLHSKMVEHIESAGVKKQLEGISRADIAQADSELSYEKAKDVKGNIAATESEAGMKVDIGQIAKQGDLGKTLGYLNALSGVSGSQYAASTQMARGESAYLLNKYENQLFRKGTKYSFLSQAAGYVSGLGDFMGTTPSTADDSPFDSPFLANRNRNSNSSSGRGGSGLS